MIWSWLWPWQPGGENEVSADGFSKRCNMFNAFAKGSRPLSSMGRSAIAWEPPGIAPTETDPVKYFSGLDLGRPSEFTALAVLERTTNPDLESPGRKLKFYAVRHLERFELGTSFPDICTRL